MINQAVILVGGKGSRLGKITKRTPKPLLKINDRPFLDYLINFFIKFKVNNILLITKYKHELFRKKYHNKKIGKVIIKCLKQNKFLGTSGSIKEAINKLNNKFFLSNGDTIFDINLFDFQKRFKEKFAGILACSNIQEISKRYSLFNKNREKAISSGIYLLKKNNIKKYLISPGSLENEVINKIPKNKFKTISYSKKFIDIGTQKDLKRANKFLNHFEKKKCAFLDRDGVINYDYGYVHKKNNFKWKKNIFKAIKLLNDNNYYVIIISNQSGIGRSYYNKSDVDSLHCWINKKLNNYGAYIDKFYFAPYYKFSKNKKYLRDRKDRKPNIGMFLRALNDFNIIKKGSFYIGDKNVDRIAAKNFKIKYLNVDNNSDLYKLIFSLLKNDLKKKL